MDDTGDDSDKLCKAALAEALVTLKRRFDVVNILASVVNPENGETESFCDGFGNWNARYGHARRWVIRSEAVEAHDVTKDLEDDE